MENFDNNKKQVINYLKDKMSPARRQEFEKEIASDSKLKDLVEDTALFEIGSSIIDKIEEGHIGSKMLARFAEGNFENETARKDIEEHLDKCVPCREQLNLCRLTIKKLEEMPATISVGLFGKFFEYLLTPRLTFKLVYAPFILLLLAVPTYLTLMNSQTGLPSKAIYELTESIERNVAGTGYITVEDKTEIIELRFIVPVIDSYLYNFNIYDANGNLVVSKPNNKPQKVFALELPTSYLTDGNYTLVVDELGDGKIVLESYKFYFGVSYSE